MKNSQNEKPLFVFEDCAFCGMVMEPHNLEFRNMLEENGIVRFDFCPSCGSNMNDMTDDLEWQCRVMKWAIERRKESK